MKKIVVYASGEGTNFSAIVDSGILVEKVITNNPTAGVIKRAENYGIPVVVLNKNGEQEIKPSKNCKDGDSVWVLEGEDFEKVKIFKNE